MKSPITGKEMPLKRTLSKLKFRKDEFQFYKHFYHCENSGEHFTTSDLDELNLRQVHNQYRDKHNIPFQNEIKEIRRNFDLPSSKMSKILGFGPNSYRNYENGEMPSISNGKLIQLISKPSSFRDMVNSCDSLENDFKIKLLGCLEEQMQTEKQNRFSMEMKLYLLGNGLPDSHTGFVKPDFEKLTEMVKFFAEKITPWKTSLNKLLFYSDFLAYRQRCYSISGTRYRAIQRGPVPNNYDSIYDYMVFEKNIIKVNHQISNDIYGDRFEIFEDNSFNEEIFNDFEIEILNKVYTIFKDMTASDVVRFSHKEKAWEENEKDKRLIDYKYAFAIDQV